MTKTKKAIKEANKVADQEILKARLAGLYAAGLCWLDTEAFGHKRGHILLATAVFLAIVFTAS